MKTELEIAIDTIALRSEVPVETIQKILREADAINWQLKPKQSPEPPNIPLDACGAGDVGFVAHELGGK